MTKDEKKVEETEEVKPEGNENTEGEAETAEDTDKNDSEEKEPSDEGEKPSWDKAVKSDEKYVKLEEKKPKKLLLTNFRLEDMHKFGKLKTCFLADCVSEDGEALDPPKTFESSSARLNKELRGHFEGKDPAGQIAIEITMIGTAYDTQYFVRAIGGEK